MTRSSGLVLPGRVCKVDRVALSDSRGIPIGPYTGPSDPPVSPRNPTWEPHTQVEGLWAETPPPRPGSHWRLYAQTSGSWPVLFTLPSAFASSTLQASAQPGLQPPPLASPPPCSQPAQPPRLGRRPLPQLPLFVLLLLDLGVQGRDALFALLQHGLLPGKRQGSHHAFCIISP